VACGLLRGPRMTVRDRHAAERQALLLSRLRSCVRLAVAGALFFGLDAWLVDGPRMRIRVAFAGAYAGLSLVVTLLLAVPRTHRHAPRLALAYVLALIGLIAAHYALLGEVELATATLLALIVGVTVLLPWGAGYQLVVGAGGAVAYAWVAAHGTVPIDPGALVLLLTMAGVAVAAAGIFERYRREACERTWQQEHLLAFGRELAERTDGGEIVAKLLERGRQLLGAKTAVMAPFDPKRRLYRVEYAAGGEPTLLGAEVPEDCAPAPRVVADGLLALPEDDPRSPLVHMMAARGTRRLLMVAMRHGGEVIGIVTFVRAVDVAFLPAERRLAHGLADEAAVALRTARLVADLRAASQLKSEFVSTMSHELRTPLNVILGYAEMVRDRALDEEERLHAAGLIEKAGRELLELIENTLQIGRFESGHAELRLERVALAALWEELGRRCAELPRPPGVRLDWLPAPTDLPVLETDPRKLALVVRNLVGNALKFTDHGWVRAAVRVDGGDVLVSVADSGVGIRPEDQEKIFEMFRQADQSDRRPYGGIGLGLYIVRRFVTQLGGTVTVDSAPGRGSTFTVRLGPPPGIRAAA
jgi:signal transduction histidine kinase